MKTFVKGLTAVLSAGLMLTTAVAPVIAEGDDKQDATLTKQESVYLILNPDGSTQSQTVSCWLHNDGGLKGITDFSNLSDIQNIKSDVKPQQNIDTVTWDTDDVDVYYNGTSTKTPPVTLSITYSLDGTEMTEKELRGKSGHLEMTIHVTNNEKQRKTINGKEQDLYTPFVVGMVLDMPTKTFKNVHAGDANVISDSTNQLVSLLSVPGLKENFGDLLTDDMKDLTDKLQDTFTVEADVTEFAMPTFMAAAATSMEQLKEIDLNDKLDDLEKGMDSLDSAAAKLKDGSAQLHDALAQFDEKMGEFKSSYDQFDQGLLSAVNGATTLQAGTKQLDDAINQLKGQVQDELVAGITGSATLQQQLVTKMEELKKQLAGLQLPDMTAIQTQLVTAIGQVSDGSADVAVRVLTGGKTLQQLATSENPVEQAQAKAIMDNLKPIKEQAAQQIAQMMSKLDLSALTTLQSSLTEIDALSTKLMGGMSQLTAALYDPNDDLSDPKTLTGAIMALSVGADKLNQGAGDLATGLNTLTGASTKVKDAVGAFQDATSQLNDKSGELSDGMSQFKTDGIDKLTDNKDLIDKARQALAVKDAMEEQAQVYGSYSGAPEGAEVTSAFIMKVAEPTEQETKEETKTETKEDENFFMRIWNSIVDFFKGLFD